MATTYKTAKGETMSREEFAAYLAAKQKRAAHKAELAEMRRRCARHGIYLNGRSAS